MLNLNLQFHHQNAKSPMFQKCSFCTFRPIPQDPLYIWRQKVAHSVVLEMGNLLIEVRSKIHFPHKCAFLIFQATHVLHGETTVCEAPTRRRDAEHWASIKYLLVPVPHSCRPAHQNLFSVFVGSNKSRRNTSLQGTHARNWFEIFVCSSPPGPPFGTTKAHDEAHDEANDEAIDDSHAIAND